MLARLGGVGCGWYHRQLSTYKKYFAFEIFAINESYTTTVISVIIS